MADCPQSRSPPILVSVINPDGVDPRAMPPPASRLPPPAVDSADGAA
jgi:hypothetical protein